MLKQLLKTKSAAEIATAMRGLMTIAPDPSLRMIYGKSRIGPYVGFQSAFNAGVTPLSARSPHTRSAK